MIKKEKVNVTISRRMMGGHIDIEISGEQSRDARIEIKMLLSEFAKCITGLGYCEGEAEIYNPELFGKVRISEHFQFEVVGADSKYSAKSKKMAEKQADENCPEGWIISKYFNSQNSFVEKDGKIYANTRIIKYVEKEEKE